MNTRPITTLFMLMSVDGKISTGNSDKRDFDKDLPTITGVKEGLAQYYNLEQQTDLASFNTGKVMKKIGVNHRKDIPVKLPVSFVIIDNRPHLTAKGVTYLLQKTKKLILVTINKKHPAFKIKADNLIVLSYSKRIDLKQLFNQLKTVHKINRLTLQSGSTMNAELIRNGLVDAVSIVVAPCLIGGKDTAALMGGKSLFSDKDLNQLMPLKLKKATVLKNSYLHLQYSVVKKRV